jgi:hypothetical protein
VLKGGEKNVLRLRNTPPLFQAFEYAYAKLERELLPQFHHSEDVSTVQLIKNTMIY